MTRCEMEPNYTETAKIVHDHCGNTYHVHRLTKQLARKNQMQLLAIHNIIPHVHWEDSNLLADKSLSGDPYVDKWKLSFMITRDDGKVIGLLIAYLRDKSVTHPLRAIYIHRLAIAPHYQGNGIGSSLLISALEDYPRILPDISTFTVQTNDEDSNRKVISFYESIGFKRFLPVRYPEKLDILMQLSR